MKNSILLLLVPKYAEFGTLCSQKDLSGFCILAGHMTSVFLYVQNSKNVISAMLISKEILFVVYEYSGTLCKSLSQPCALRRGRACHHTIQNTNHVQGTS